jgi:hypothetical protein
MFATCRARKDIGLIRAARAAIWLLIVLFPTILRAQTNCTSPPAGLVSWWRAEGNALDWTGGNNGTIEGDVTYGPGEVGQAFVFSGDQCGVEVGDATNLDLQNFTVECWIQRATNTLGGYIFSIGTASYLGGWILAVYDDGTLALFDNYNSEAVESPVGVTDSFLAPRGRYKGWNQRFFLR